MCSPSFFQQFWETSIFWLSDKEKRGSCWASTFSSPLFLLFKCIFFFQNLTALFRTLAFTVITLKVTRELFDWEKNRQTALTQFSCCDYWNAPTFLVVPTLLNSKTTIIIFRILGTLDTMVTLLYTKLSTWSPPFCILLLSDNYNIFKYFSTLNTYCNFVNIPLFIFPSPLLLIY